MNAAKIEMKALKIRRRKKTGQRQPRLRRVLPGCLFSHGKDFCLCKKICVNALFMMPYKVERLGDLHDHDGNERKRDADDVHFPRHILIAETEHAHDARGKQHERDERDREQRHPVEHLVGEGTDLEQRMSRTHVVCVERLRERKHQEGRRAALFGAQMESVARDAVARQRQRRKHTALQHDLQAVAVGEDALFFGAGLVVHDVGLQLLHAQRHGGQRVADQVDPQKLNGDEGGDLPDTHGKEDDDDLGDIRAEQEADHLLDIGIDASAFLHGVHDRGKVVVGERHVRRALGNVRARDAHCAADVRRLQRGRVVDAVARHRNHLSLFLPRLDDADLILGRDARIYGDILHFRIQLFVAHCVQLRARDRLVAVQQDAQLLRNGGCCHHMVARDHHGFDARLAADRDRLLRFGARRIDHAHKT